MSKSDQVLATIQKYWKALAGTLTPGVGLIIAATGDKSPGGDAITHSEWIGIVLAIVAGGSVVAIAPKNTEQPDDTDIDDDDAEKAEVDAHAAQLEMGGSSSMTYNPLDEDDAEAAPAATPVPAAPPADTPSTPLPSSRSEE